MRPALRYQGHRGRHHAADIKPDAHGRVPHGLAFGIAQEADHANELQGKHGRDQCRPRREASVREQKDHAGLDLGSVLGAVLGGGSAPSRQTDGGAIQVDIHVIGPTADFPYVRLLMFSANVHHVMISNTIAAGAATKGAARRGSIVCDRVRPCTLTQ